MDKSIENKLRELMNEISTLPSSDGSKRPLIVSRKTAKAKPIKKNIDSLQNSLDNLRVSIKYLLFDLEATRRENSQLKKMLTEDEK